MTSAQANFQTKRLSVWINADQALFNMDAWAKCADLSLRREDFLGEHCWIGIDLAPQPVLRSTLGAVLSRRW
jgi:phage terminase large subunit-like protein